jgi:hypothetical protein
LKKLLENKEMVFKNGVMNIQAAAYNGACSPKLNDFSFADFKLSVRIFLQKADSSGICEEFRMNSKGI